MYYVELSNIIMLNSWLESTYSEKFQDPARNQTQDLLHSYIDWIIWK